MKKVYDPRSNGGADNNTPVRSAEGQSTGVCTLPTISRKRFCRAQHWSDVHPEIPPIDASHQREPLAAL